MWYATNKFFPKIHSYSVERKMALIVQTDYRVDISNTGLERLIHLVNPAYSLLLKATLCLLYSFYKH